MYENKQREQYKHSVHIQSYRVLNGCINLLINYYMNTIECIATGSRPREEDKPVGQQVTAQINISR